MKNIFILILLGSIFISCSKKITPAETTVVQLTDFTDALVKKYDWSPADLAKIQFYISKEVLLTKNLSSNYSEIKNGVVLVGGEKHNEEIKLPEGTPGVFIRLTSNGSYAMSFDTLHPQELLFFGANPSQGGTYTLSTKQDNSTNTRSVNYLGNLWNVTASSLYAGLQVDLKQALNETREKTIMSGRTVKD